MQKGDAQLLLQALEFLLHLPAQFQIQCAQQFVQKKQFLLLDHGARNGHALALPAGKLLRHALCIVRKLDQFQHFAHAAGNFPSLHAHGHSP